MSERIPSELGDLPPEWRTNRFDSLFAVQQGKQVSKKNRVGGNQCAFLRTRNVFWGRLDLSELDEMNFTEADEKRLALSCGDLLICEGGDIGRTAIWNGELARCYYQNHLHRARLRNGNASPRFILFWLWYAFEVGSVYFGRGIVTTIPNLSQSKLCELPLPVPPLDEQRKIAAVLSLVQRAMGHQERLLVLTADLKKALLHHLFTHGLRREPQKQTELGPVPRSWKEVKLNGIADLKNGYAFSSKDYIASSNTLNVRMSNIRPGGEFNLDYSLKYLPDAYAKSHSSFLITDGDLIIAMTDMANDPKILGVPTIVRNALGRNLLLNQRVGKLVPTQNSEVNFEFLKYFLTRREAQDFLISRAKKGVQVNIGKKDILSIPISYPSKKEQEIITSIFRLLDRRIDGYRGKYAALSALFRTLLHELMTARIRVHDLDLQGI
jgi:type I restriction enzyme, S subunit